MAIQRPTPKTTQAKTVDDWVSTRNGNVNEEEVKQASEAIKRFTVLMPEALHQELKISCAKQGVLLKDFVLDAIIEKLKK